MIFPPHVKACAVFADEIGDAAVTELRQSGKVANLTVVSSTDYNHHTLASSRLPEAMELMRRLPYVMSAYRLNGGCYCSKRLQ